jgi:hypothetical protein
MTIGRSEFQARIRRDLIFSAGGFMFAAASFGNPFTKGE